MKYLLAIYGNVATSLEYLTEGEIKPVSDDFAASQEITNFVTAKYIKVFNTIDDARAFSFTPFVQLAQQQSHTNNKNWSNSPTNVLNSINTDQAVLLAQSTLARHIANLAEVTADQAAAATALASDPSNTTKQNAKADADTVLAVFTAKKSAADTALATALAAQATAISALV